MSLNQFQRAMASARQQWYEDMSELVARMLVEQSHRVDRKAELTEFHDELCGQALLIRRLLGTSS